MAPAVGAALIGVGGGILNTLGGLFGNKQQQNINAQTYERMRKDSLADWNMMNEYNSPKMQMQRFKEAGLNPNLIYGQSFNAPPVRSSDFKPADYAAPRIGSEITGALQTYYQVQTQEQQLQNMKLQAALLDAQKTKTESETDWKKLQTDFFQRTEPYREELLSSQGQLLQASKEKTREQLVQIRESIKEIQPRINKMISETNLNYTKQEQAKQIISNLITTQRLLNKKIVTEDAIQEVYYGKSNLQGAQTSKTRTDEYVSQELLQLKQMGLPIEITKGALLTKPYISKPNYKR